MDKISNMDKTQNLEESDEKKTKNEISETLLMNTNNSTDIVKEEKEVIFFDENEISVNDRLNDFIKKLQSNLKKEFKNENKTLNKIQNIISYTKNEMNNSNSKNDSIISEKPSKIKDSKLTKEIMVENLKKLIPDREKLGWVNTRFYIRRDNNEVEKFCVLLDTYVKEQQFDFKDLQLSKDDMTNTLVWFISNNKCENRNELFIKLLNIYDKNNDFDLNYQATIGKCSYDKETLVHWCIVEDNLVILNYLLSNYKNRIDFSVKNNGNETPYQLAIQRGKYNMATLVLESSLGMNLSRSITNFCDDDNEINSVSQLFLLYLYKNCGNSESELDKIMKILEKTLINLIDNKKCFSKYLLKIIFDYNIIKNNKLSIVKYNSNNLVLNTETNKLWQVIKEKLELVLSIETLYKEKVDWFWFKNYILNTNIWLYKIDDKQLLYTQLETIVKMELSKQKSKLKEDMKLLIKQNQSVWSKICDFEYVNSKYKSHRQDIISNGIQSLYSKKLLNNINVSNNSKGLEIFSINDYNNYLSNLIILGHKLNKYFTVSINNIFNDYLLDKKCNFRGGPVKKLERCITKSQLDYNTCKYPTSSHIIDIIRGSLTFDDLEYYYNAIKLFIEAVSTNKDKITHYISDILRIKNGFSKSYKKYTEKKEKEEKEEKTNVENEIFVPNKYLDIKINLIITYNNESIIGELQLLLLPMLNNKKENHELYEITRLKDIIVHSNNKLKGSNPTKQLEIAITDKNKYDIAKIIAYNNINDININKIGNDGDETPLFLTIIEGNSSVDLIFKYFEDNINYSLCNRVGWNILHYIAKHLKANNEANKFALQRILNKIIPKQLSIINQRDNDLFKLTPIMRCLEHENEFVVSQILLSLAKYPNLSIIDFSVVNGHNNNIFHYLFWRCNFNNISFDLIMNRYELYKKTNNIKNYNLLFAKGEHNKTIFHWANSKSMSLKILKQLESYLNDSNKFYHFIFLHQDTDNASYHTRNSTPLMHVIFWHNLDILEYLFKKFKGKIIESNYKPLIGIKRKDWNGRTETVMDILNNKHKGYIEKAFEKELPVFKSHFPNLFSQESN